MGRPIGRSRATSSKEGRPSSRKSEVYFGLRAAEGKVVDEQAWEQFVAEVLVPRFPAGLTILAGSGRSGGGPGSLNPTRILVVVHPKGEDGIFHTDQPVRIHSND